MTQRFRFATRGAAYAGVAVGIVAMIVTGLLAATAARRCGGSATVATFASLSGILMIATLGPATQYLSWRGLFRTGLFLLALQALTALVGCAQGWLR